MIRGTFTRIGRITLWILFFPLGMWRSIVHSQAKRDRRLEENLRNRP